MVKLFLNLIKSTFRFLFRPTEYAKTPTDIALDSRMSLTLYKLREVEHDIEYVIKERIKRFFKYKKLWFTLRIMQLSLICTLGYFTVVYFVAPTIRYIYPAAKIMQSDTQLSYPDGESMSMENFLLQLQYCESSYTPGARRPGSQYWGLYALGTDARNAGGYSEVSYDFFTKHPDVQHLCVIS